MGGRRLDTVALSLARLTNAQWVAVSLFEGVIDLPDRIAQQPTGSALGHGSPARYHLPAAVPTMGTAVAACVLAQDQPWRQDLGLALAGTVVSAGLTGFLIRSVNIPLLHGSVDAEGRARLVRRWHCLNKVRLLALIIVAMILERAAMKERSQ